MKREKTEREIRWLLTECGMCSRDENYDHATMRQLVAKAIYDMPAHLKQALINTLQFLLYEHKGD